MGCCREGVAQAAKDYLAAHPPTIPPPEVATSKRTPRSNQAAVPKAPAKQPGQAPSPRRKKLTAAANIATGASSGSADPAVPADSELGKTAGEEQLPEELTKGLAAWQQFQEEAKALLLGRPQQDNAVHLLQPQADGKEAEKLLLEVQCLLQIAAATQSCTE